MDRAKTDTDGVKYGSDHQETYPSSLPCLPGRDRPCSVRVLVGGRLLECLEERRDPCEFAVDFGLGRFCECALYTVALKNPPCTADDRA